MRLVPLTNKLVYPSRQPGFDPTHFAAQGMHMRHGYSCVAQTSNNFLNILTGQRGTIGGTATNIIPGIHGIIGPNLGFTLANSNRITFAGNSTANDSILTFAAIWYTPVWSTSTVIGNSSGNSGVEASYQSSGQLGLLYPTINSTYTANVICAANVPYFTIWSRNQVVVNFLALNLTTGAIRTDSLADTFVPLGTNGTWAVGGAAHYGTSNIAAAMFAPNFLSLAAMKLWATDPWAFWYPRTTENIIQIALAAAHGGAYANTYTQLITAAMASQKTVGKILSN